MPLGNPAGYLGQPQTATPSRPQSQTQVPLYGPTSGVLNPENPGYTGPITGTAAGNYGLQNRMAMTPAAGQQVLPALPVAQGFPQRTPVQAPVAQVRDPRFPTQGNAGPNLQSLMQRFFGQGQQSDAGILARIQAMLSGNTQAPAWAPIAPPRPPAPPAAPPRFVSNPPQAPGWLGRWPFQRS